MTTPNTIHHPPQRTPHTGRQATAPDREVTSRQSTVFRWSARHPWLVLITAFLLLAGGIGAVAGGITLSTNTEDMVGDSKQAQLMIDGTDFGATSVEVVAVSPRDPGSPPGLTQTDLMTRAADFANAYRALAGVDRVDGPVPGRDGRGVMLQVHLKAKPGEASATDQAAQVTAVVERQRAEHPTMQIGQLGDASVRAEVNDTVRKDMTRAEFTAIPVTLIVLLLAFGAVVAAGVPMLLGLTSVILALGGVALWSQHLGGVHGSAQIFVTLIGLAVGVDYALFIIRRFAEERHDGRAVLDAIGVAGATAGRAVMISGVAVVVAFGGLFVAGGMFASIALGGVLVVSAAVLTSCTALPALLSLLGDKLFALRIPFLPGQKSATSGFWTRLGRWVARRPWATGAAGISLMVALASPVLTMTTTLSGLDMLPHNLQSVQAARQLETIAPQVVTHADVVIQVEPGRADQASAALAAALATPIAGVQDVSAPERRSLDGRTILKPVAMQRTEGDREFAADIERLRERVIPAVQDHGGPNVQVAVGGGAAGSDLGQWMNQRLPWVIGFVLVLTFVVMMLAFGSLTLAAITIGLNALSVGAAYGAIVLVFQYHWAETLLDFKSAGAVVGWLPLILFVTLFGLSMDYHIFVTSRIREARAQGHTLDEAIALGLGRSATVVTSAAAVMVAVFCIFAMLSSLELKQMGVGLAVAIALDATLVRGVLMPALFAMAGERIHRRVNWLPALHA